MNTRDIAEKIDVNDPGMNIFLVWGEDYENRSPIYITGFGDKDEIITANILNENSTPKHYEKYRDILDITKYICDCNMVDFIEKSAQEQNKYLIEYLNLEPVKLLEWEDVHRLYEQTSKVMKYLSQKGFEGTFADDKEKTIKMSTLYDIITSK